MLNFLNIFFQPFMPSLCNIRAYPFNESRSSTLMVCLFLNRTTRIARPIADSAAATVRIKNTNTWPLISCRKCENAIKFILTDSSISSIHINRIITFFRLMNIPATLIQNSMAASIRTSDKTIICSFHGARCPGLDTNHDQLNPSIVFSLFTIQFSLLFYCSCSACILIIFILSLLFTCTCLPGCCVLVPGGLRMVREIAAIIATSRIAPAISNGYRYWE